jgi:hypothetical protein
MILSEVNVIVNEETIILCEVKDPAAKPSERPFARHMAIPAWE